MAISTSAGAEVQRPLATAVICGDDEHEVEFRVVDELLKRWPEDR